MDSDYLPLVPSKSSLSSTLKTERLESQIDLMSLGAIQAKDVNRIATFC
jgi:hypothetical protein